MIRPFQLALLFVFTSVGCDACDDAASAPSAEATPPARAPAPPPAGLDWELSLGGGSATLQGARALFGDSSLANFVPESPSEVVERLASGLDVGDRVAADAPIHAVGVRVGARSLNVVAVPVRTDADRSHPLGASVPIVPGAPEGGVWLGEEPGEGAAGAALVDDVLVFGESAEAIRAALPYLAFTLVPREVEDGVTAKMGEHLGAELRRLLDTQLREMVTEQMGRAEEERARHDGPPDFGEPEAMVQSLRRFAEVWLSYLPDLGAIEIRITPTDGALVATLDADVRSGSPLEERLTQTPAGDTAGISALPRDTAVALSVRAPLDEEPRFSIKDALAAVAGDRLDRRGAAALDAFDTAWETARGPEAIYAAGGGAEDAWLAAVLPSPRDELPESVVGGAFGTRYLAALAGLFFECPQTPRPRIGAAICSGAPTLFASTSRTRSTLGLTRAPTTAAALADPGGATVGAEPDVRRALDALGEDQLFTVLLVPSRLMPIAGISSSEAFQRISRVTALAIRPAPITLGIGKSDQGVRLDLRADARAIEDLVRLADGL